MKSLKYRLTAAIVATTISLLTARAATFSESFTGGVFDSSLTLSSDAGFSIFAANDRLEYAKQSGIGNGGATAITSFQMVGDFSVTVRCARPNLGANGTLGLAVFIGSGFADVFFQGSGTGSVIASNILLSGGPGGGGSTANSSSTATFRILRVGTTLTLQYDTGSGFQTKQSATVASAAGTAKVDLFLLNEYGSTVATNGWFDDLSITADSFSSAILLQPTIEVAAVQISWPSRSDRHYQVEYTSTLSNVWAPLGSLMNGTGATMSTTDSTLGRPQRFYRIVESP